MVSALLLLSAKSAWGLNFLFFGDTKAEYVFFPIIVTDPNEGQEYGGMPIAMFVDDEGETRGIIAPSVSYNSIIGPLFAFRLFGFPEKDSNYVVYSAGAPKILQEHWIEYENQTFLGPNFYLYLKPMFLRDPFRRFYGIGADSQPDEESNFTQREWSFEGSFGVNLPLRFRLGYASHIQFVGIQKGGAEGLPYAPDIHPEVRGASMISHEIYLQYDNRDLKEYSVEGTYLKVWYRFASKSLGGDASFQEYGADFRHLIPLPPTDRFTLALRGLIAKQHGDDIPFFALNSLGGANEFRGYGWGRFVDKGKLLFSAEQRIRLFRSDWFGVTADWHMDPFVEVGRVFSEYGDLSISKFQVCQGIGLRALVRPNVLGRVDVGLSREGPNIFVEIDYPF